MARTMTNVIGNCLATVVVAKWEGEFVEASDEELALAAAARRNLTTWHGLPRTADRSVPLVLRGRRARPDGAADTAPVRLVEGHVPHRASTTSRRSATSPASPSSPRASLSPLATLVLVAPHALRRAADVPAGRRAQPARPGQHLAPRGAPAALARQGAGAVPARIRRHRLHHHDHPVGRRRHRAHHREPAGAALDAPSGRCVTLRAARGARRGLPQRLPRGGRARGADRRGLPRR